MARRSFVARRLILPTQAFFHTEGPGGVILLVSSLVALAIANSPLAEGFERILEMPLGLELGRHSLRGDLRELINDGLMTVFFYIAGLEIKRELVEGRLSDPRRAALPVAAALGGMIVPALIYAALNHGRPGAHGWGVPMATDIAFSVGVLIVLGDRVPASVRVFLLALAIADDIGAILVIAVFYSQGVYWPALGAASLILVVILAMNRGGVRSTNAYLVASLVFWVAMLASGVHATIAGVILGALTPMRPWFSLYSFEKSAGRLLRRFRRVLGVGDFDRAESLMGQMEELSRGTESPLDRRLRQVHPWSSYIVLPLFALANSGVALSAQSLGHAATDPITWGIVLGLVVGKPLGILGLARLAVALRLARPLEGATWGQILGVGMVAGIGFTVSLFVTGLAFEEASQVNHAKIGVLAASGLAGVLGLLVLRFQAAPRPVESRLEELAVVHH
jgi:NhaA family Na+:H+ antiporter